jgi:hypothetical protein
METKLIITSFKRRSTPYGTLKSVVVAAEVHPTGRVVHARAQCFEKIILR